MELPVSPEQDDDRFLVREFGRQEKSIRPLPLVVHGDWRRWDSPLGQVLVEGRQVAEVWVSLLVESLLERTATRAWVPVQEQ